MVHLGEPVTDLVVIVPGILGSRLTKNGDEVWGTSPRRLLVNLLTFGRTLRTSLAIPFDVDPDDPRDGVEPAGLITGLVVIPGFLGIDFYDQLRFNLRQDLELGEGQLDDFAYDWRLSCRVNGALLTAFLDEKLDRYRATSGRANAKAILVCHSMGGLVARWCADQAQGGELIRTIITIGTPHKGSMHALDAIANGVRLPRRVGVDLTTMALSLPSLYELLPTYSCVRVDGRYYGLGHQAILDRIVGLCPIEVPALADRIDRGLSLHSDLLQDLPETGPTAYGLVCFRGAEQPTPISADLGATLRCVEEIDGVARGGDGVVPDDSGIPAYWNDTTRAKGAEGKHSTMASGAGLREEIRVTLRHTGRLQSPVIAATSRLPTELPAGQGFQATVQALTRSDGRRPPLNLKFTVTPIETKTPVAEFSVPSVGEPPGYRAAVPGLPAGLYQLSWRPANHRALAIDELADWLVVYEDGA